MKDQRKHLVNSIWLLITLALIVILQGCGASGPPTNAGFHLAVKANNFMNVAALLFAQGPEFWGQGLRNIYYSALSLARLKNVNAFHDSTEKFHVKVWSISPLPIRNYFANDMKKVRTRYDYDLDVEPNEVSSDFSNFLKNGVTPFNCLLDQAENNIMDGYHKCNNNPSTCIYCSNAKVPVCLKQASKAELETVHGTLTKIVSHNSDLVTMAKNVK